MRALRFLLAGTVLMVKQWFGYENMRVLNILGMYRWVTNHRRGVW